MKLALNGALTIGTLDGANVEMREEIGADHFFIFGMTADQVAARRAAGYNSRDHYEENAELRQALDMIGRGYFSAETPDLFQPIVDSLLAYGDHYMLLADYASYIECQDQVDALYRNQDEWSRHAILNVAGMGKFSSDRTIAEYASKVWNVRPVRA
jgi:starch phosphorylase